MFYSTKLDWTPRQILSAYACRWAIECTFENCKQFLGLEDPANRLPKAVARTAPMALFIYSLVVVWFHKSGHQLLRFPFRPWYRADRQRIAGLFPTAHRVLFVASDRQRIAQFGDASECCSRHLGSHAFALPGLMSSASRCWRLHGKSSKSPGETRVTGDHHGRG